MVQKRTEPKSRDISSRMEAKACESELCKRISDWECHKGYTSIVYLFPELIHSCFTLAHTLLCIDRNQLPVTYLALETLRLFLLLMLGNHQ